MITCTAWSGKKFAVLGLARSGQAAADALLASGAEVMVWDRQHEPREAFEGRARIGDPMVEDLTGFDGLVVSPGVPLNTHPIVPRARSFGVPVIGDIELFAQARAELPPHKVVGITGTNGKSTTTALVHHILKTAGVPTTMGGNIGLPILGQEPLPDGGVYVLELSSYQIDLTQTLDCDVAVLLNVTPDHLDRYGSFEEYLASKIRLLEMQGPESIAIVASTANGLDAAVMKLDVGANLTQWFHGDFARDFALEQPRWPSLQGPHNAQNAWSARVCCLALGLGHDEIDRGLETYRGLPHRMERVTTHNGVLFINDSKATNTDSAAPALAAFPPEGNGPRIHWIVGGLPKEDGLGATEAHLANVKVAYTIGEAGPRFAELLEGRVPVDRSELVDAAVRRAMRVAVPGDVILLSPACASFDQFKDFERRGEHFRQIVGALTGENGGQAA